MPKIYINCVKKSDETLGKEIHEEANSLLEMEVKESWCQLRILSAEMWNILLLFWEIDTNTV